MELKYGMGDELKDPITGFTGIVLSITEHSTGCIHYGLQAQSLDKDGKPGVDCWFDQTRLTPVNAKKVDFPTPAPQYRLFQQVKDKVTALKGTILAVARHSDNTVSYGIQQSELDKNGKVRDYEWTGEHRIILVKDVPKAKDEKEPPGGPGQECSMR